MFFSFSESSGEESAGEREEEMGAQDDVNRSTMTTEVLAEQTSNTQTGKGEDKSKDQRASLNSHLYICHSQIKIMITDLMYVGSNVHSQQYQTFFFPLS